VVEKEKAVGKKVSLHGRFYDFVEGSFQINPEEAREEFCALVSKDGGTGVKDFMDSVGLGAWVGELSELKLGELLDIPPSGLDEAMAISKVCVACNQHS
jgi:hypothetical protein